MSLPPLVVAIAGNRDITPGMGAGVVLGRLARLPEDSLVLLRHPKSATRHPGRFEHLVAGLCDVLSIEHEWVKPEGSDRSQVYLRDLDMVRRSDYVIAFFSSPAMEGGTSHVVDAALSQGIAVESLWVKENGEVERIGEYDPSRDGP